MSTPANDWPDDDEPELEAPADPRKAWREHANAAAVAAYRERPAAYRAAIAGMLEAYTLTVYPPRAAPSASSPGS